MECSSCVYYEKTDIRQGECHRMPPSVVVMAAHGGMGNGPQVVSMFAPTKSENWCGEYREKEVKEKGVN